MEDLRKAAHYLEIIAELVYGEELFEQPVASLEGTPSIATLKTCGCDSHPYGFCEEADRFNNPEGDF